MGEKPGSWRFRMTRSMTEWVTVADGMTIIARESGEVWFHRPGVADADMDPFVKRMTGAGAVSSTVGLLDGAIHLGFASSDREPPRGDATLIGYVLALVGAYHTSVNTPRNLRRAARRFARLGRPEVAAYLEKRAREETGHDRLALKDLNALGLPGARIVANLMPEGIAPLCDRFDALCLDDYPIGSIGYSYCLERIAALKQKEDIDRVAALCPPDVDATRFLRSHSCLGSEVAHVEDTIEFVASLPADDRIRVVEETYRSALIMASGYRHELNKPDTAVLEELEAAAGEVLWPCRHALASVPEGNARPAA
ncbi:MAG: hypothetical protein ACM3N5_01435 [Candidatus Eiseniibacteriota bacterium]